MVEFKPYTVTVAAVQQSLTSGNVFENPQAGTPSASVDVYIEAMTPKETYERYGTALTDCFYGQCELADGPKFTPNCEVYWSGNLGTVQLILMGDPEYHDAGDETDHVDLYFRRLQYADPNLPG